MIFVQQYSLLLKSVCSKLSCPLPQSMAASSQNLSSANKVARQHILKEREEVDKQCKIISTAAYRFCFAPFKNFSLWKDHLIMPFLD